MRILFLLACTRADTDTDDVDPLVPAIVPAPVLVEAAAGTFVLDSNSTISGDAAVATLLAEALRPSTGLPLDVVPSDGTIALRISAGLPEGGYTLDVTASGVDITASGAAGLFWGTQTLRQLLPPESLGTERASGPWEIPLVHIEDAPRFAWRGLMIDVARHFFTKEEIERQIDLIALHKLDRLHLHLTDDQGWRIALDSAPELAEIGGATEVGGGPGGYYTKEDWAEIVAYADARHVTVVPEIDFPGHANAALATYGELNESGEPADPYTGAPVLSAPLCLDCPATRPLVEAVWTEMCAMTPGPWVHVGADEAIGVPDDDYRDFVRWLETVIQAQGKTMIGWDEIGVVPLDGPFLAQHWYDEERAKAAFDQGGVLIASPARRAYFDMIYDDDAEFGQVWAGPIDVETAYDWAPWPPGVSEDGVIGVEATLFTELVEDQDQMDFMLWPRLSAQAELGWSAASDWEDFRRRMRVHGRRLDALGVGFYRSPEIDW